MKTKKKNPRIFVVCLTVLALAISLFAAQFRPTATYAAEDDAAEQAYSIVEGQFDEYTNFQNLYNRSSGQNETQKIGEYAAYAQQRYGTLREQAGTPTDEWLLKIVPEELFQHPGQYFYLGKTYGFFVDHEAENQYFVYLISNKIDPTELDGVIKMTVKPLFYNEFTYDQESGTVKPVVFSAGDNFSGHLMSKRDIYLKDIHFTGSVANVYHANKGTEFYPVYDDRQDLGSFFIGSSYRFNAVRPQSAGPYIGALIESVIGALPLGKYVDAALSFIDITKSLCELGQAVGNNLQENITNDKWADALKLDEITRAAQLEKYQQLMKTGMSGLVSTDEDPILFDACDANNYAATKFLLNASSEDGQYLWTSRVSTSVSFDIVEREHLSADYRRRPDRWGRRKRFSFSRPLRACIRSGST